MKYRVVGWTEYDDYMVEDGDASYAATNVIIDEIKKQGYLFSGWAHQELRNGAPVLNDGKKRTYSQRTFGGIMAVAHGYTGTMDYAKFAFAFRSMEAEKTPPSEKAYNPYSFKPETDLNEEFVIEVSEEVFERALATAQYKDEERAELRYIDEGDTLTLKCGDRTYSKKVTDVWSEKDVTEEDRLALYRHEEGAEEKFVNAKTLLFVCLEGYKKPVFTGFDRE